MNRHRKARLLVASMLLVVLAACGSAGDTKSTSEPTVSLPPGAPKVELLDDGAEPREEIRFHVEAGDTQRGLMRMQTSMEMTADGKKVPAIEVPPIEMGMKVEITEVRPDGVIESEFEYDAVRVDGTGSGAAAMEESLQGIVGMTGRLESTETGALLDGDLEVPSGVDPTLRSTLESFESQMKNMTVPVPTEAVGVGAVWKATAKAELNGIKTESVSRYELVARTSEGIVLELDIEQTAPEQDPEIPGIPAGSSVHLESMMMSGSGRVVIDPGALFPVSMRSRATGEVRMIVESEGDSGELLQELDVRVEMRPR